MRRGGAAPVRAGLPEHRHKVVLHKGELAVVDVVVAEDVAPLRRRIPRRPVRRT
jgi:hypothetical protein